MKFNKPLNKVSAIGGQDYSRSAKNVLHGLHYQIQHPQGNLVRVAVGEVFNVAVDIRQNSAPFGRWCRSFAAVCGSL